MSEPTAPSVNSWLEDELYHQYLYDRKTVDAGWKQVFETDGHTANGATITIEPILDEPRALAAPAVSPVALGQDDQALPLRGPALKIAENMAASLTVPTATSLRVLPVKVMDENRRAINAHRTQQGLSKLSYTHLVAWAIVRAIEKAPALNDAFSSSGGESLRVRRGHVNIGLAVDVAGKDGARSLKVPSIKKAESMSFAQFLAAYDDIVTRARGNKLAVADFEGTTISLTNPGTVGTVGSVPRLMPGQGAIIATGAIDYPPEFRGVAEDVRTSMGLSKVMTVTCTYDHRVIQGAESGLFLAQMQALLEGEDSFYERIYADLGITAQPVRWEVEKAAAATVESDPVKQAAVARLIQAWRGRGHLAADIDPLGVPRPPHTDLEPSAHGLTIWDLDRSFQTDSFGVVTLRELVGSPARGLRRQDGRRVHALRESRGAPVVYRTLGATLDSGC